jgi:protocatechuate 3,4-dioxygenase beta subunit
MTPAADALEPRDFGSQPAYVDAGYRSTALRGPKEAPIAAPAGLSERTGPVFRPGAPDPLDADLTRNGRVNGEPVGERMILTGRVSDGAGRPVAGTLVELWQANAAGRYVHAADRHDAPLDPNFFGAGHAFTDEDGRYRFLTIKPGAYPWRNHANAWRPAHIHLSLFGEGFASRLATQLYFPGDPLLPLDPILGSVPAEARDRLVSRFSLEETRPEFALGYVFDIVLRGRLITPMDPPA